MEILSNIPLARFTTLGIGGPARWFAEAATEAEVVETVDWARQRQCSLFVLGGGSNLLVSDAGFNGLVLRIALRGVSAIDPDESAQRIYRAAAGEPWENCVQRSLQDNCAGVECLAGIPGTAGGTPGQNVGAYGQEVSSVIHRVRAYDLDDRAFIELSAADCAFSYRRSRFNTTDRNRFIITRVDYRLTPNGAPTIRYADLERELASTPVSGTQPTLSEVAAAVRRIRRAKGMLIVDGAPDSRSAGSFFKNPVVSLELSQKIGARSAFPADPSPTGKPQVKIPAGWLIEQSGFPKGYMLGAAAISSRHTLALINRGSAKAADILALAHKIASAVESRFAIRLEMEPVQVGFPDTHRLAN